MALPPHSARIPLISWRVAACMALSPALASMCCRLPSGCMKMMLGISGPSGRRNRNGETFEAAQRVVVAALHRTGDLDACNLACDRRQHHLAFDAREQLADAHMDARTEPDMAGRAAGDVVAVGIVPAPRIAVGGAEEHQHLLAFANAMARKFDLPRRGAEESLHRAFETDRLFERIARQRKIVAQPRELIGEARQAIDRGAD